MKKIITLLLTCTLVIVPAYSQKDVTITGTVTNEDDMPLIQAAVVVTGTNKGVVTDLDGKYSITVPKTVKSLTFSYLGYVSQTVEIDGKTQIYVILEELVNRLDEAVSIGYMSTTVGDAAGAVQNISVKDADMRSVTSTEVLLQGKAAGLQIIQNSAQPGANEYDISIRGLSSVDDNSAPLVIVDGVPDELSRVNPKNIKRISILKDASSAAIYGNRAAGGVILIETKDGVRGLQVDYSASAGISRATSLPGIVNDPVRYIDLVNEAYLNSSQTTKYPDSQREAWAARSDANHQPTNWQPLYYRTGFLQQHHVGASGAGERYNFAFSAGYQDQKGVVYATSADNIDYQLKFNLYFLNKKVLLGANVGGKTATSHEAYSTSSLLNRYLTNRPVLLFKAVTDDGEIIYGQGATAFAIEKNGGGNDVRSSDINATFNASYMPNKKLTFKLMYNLKAANTHTTRFTPLFEYTSSVEATTRTVNRSELYDRAAWTNSTLFSATANYRETFGKKFKVNALFGYEMREFHSQWNQAHVYDLMKNAPLISFGDPNTLSNSSSASEYAALSTFGRVNFDYASRYILETNLRSDGSSRFAKGRRFGFFPSFAFAWRLNNEPWMKKVRWVDNLKFRVSYGLLGHDAVGNSYAYQDRIMPTYYSFGGNLEDATAFSMMASRETTWEKVRQLNIGVDFDFLHSFSLSADVFDKLVTDMLCTLKPVLSLGTLENGAALNIGTMRNRGIELTGAYAKMLPGRIWINVGGTMSYIENTVEDLGSASEQWHDTGGNIRSVVGYPTRSRFGYKCIGIYQTDDFTWQNDSDPTIPDSQRDYVLKPGVTTTSLHIGVRPGDLLLEDQDGDNNITPSDMVWLGRARSNLLYSFNISATYKGFDSRILFSGQGSALAYLQYYAPFNSGAGQIFTDIAEHRWTEATPQYRCLFADKERMGIVSTYNMYNAAYLRLKSIQFGYSFRGPWMDKAKIKGLRVYMSAENLLTFSHFPKGYDPERAATNSSPTSYPVMKGASLGMSLSF